MNPSIDANRGASREVEPSPSQDAAREDSKGVIMLHKLMDNSKKRRNTPTFYRLIFVGVVISFCSGFLNTSFLTSSVGLGVTHMTGFTSRAAQMISVGHFYKALEYGAPIICFFIGSVINSMVIGDSVDGGFKITWNYGVSLIIESFLICIIASIDFTLYHPFPTLVAAFLSGFQNAMLTTYSAAIVRTTHVTGILTDVGIILGATLRNILKRNGKKRIKSNLWKLQILVPLYFAFFIGGIIGGVATFYTQSSHVLFIPAGLIFLLGLAILFLVISYDRYVVKRSSSSNVQMKTTEEIRSSQVQNQPVIVPPTNLPDRKSVV